MITIRLERPEDAPLVHVINELAFGLAFEADIVGKLRNSCPEILSIVAEDGDSLAGHILFSPVVIDYQDRDVRGMGLAPMAVLPGHQNRGIGTALVTRGLEILHGRGCPFVIVLGHPDYYPRFGFAPASRHGVSCQWEGVPDEAFMILILDETAMNHVTGVARYRGEFDEAV